MQTIPETGFLDLFQIIGCPAVSPEEAAENKRNGKGLKRPRPATVGVIPVGRSTFLAGVKKGMYPAPVRFGRRTLWRAEDIRKLIQQAV